MKIEMHSHTGGGSPCAVAPADTLPKLYENIGYDAIVVTNHYNDYIAEYYYSFVYGKKFDPVDCFLRGYREALKAAEGLNIRVFLGMEIACRASGYQEFNLLGFDEKFLRENPRLYRLDQKELFALCNEAGIFMYQTHPFREGVVTGDGRYEHGVEVFNGHREHANHNDLALKLAEKYRLVRLSGSDFHEVGMEGTGGIVTDRDVASEKQLAEYLRTNQPQLIEKF